MLRNVAIAAFLVSLVPLAAFAQVDLHPNAAAALGTPQLHPNAAAALGTPQLHPNAAAALGTPGRRDAAIFKDIAKQVNGYTRFTVFDDIQASVAQGVVTLYGKVTMPYKREDIARRVATVAGVKQVVNKISVLPVSQFDDDLRYEIARAIYGNPSFWHYASMVNPPIHIVVEGGHVTLTGVVNNAVEKVLARSLASGFDAFSVESQLKTDAEARAELEKAEKSE